MSSSIKRSIASAVYMNITYSMLAILFSQVRFLVDVQNMKEPGDRYAVTNTHLLYSFYFVVLELRKKSFVRICHSDTESLNVILSQSSSYYVCMLCKKINVGVNIPSK